MNKNIISSLILGAVLISSPCFADHMNDSERGAELYERFDGVRINRALLYNSEISENYYALINRYMQNRRNNFGIELTVERLIEKAIDKNKQGLDLDKNALDLATRIIEIPRNRKNEINELSSSRMILKLADVATMSEAQAEYISLMIDEMLGADNDVLEASLIMSSLSDPDEINARVSEDSRVLDIIKELVSNPNAQNDRIRNDVLIRTAVTGTLRSCSISGNSVREECQISVSELPAYFDRVNELAEMSRKGDYPEYIRTDYFDTSDRAVNFERSARSAIFF